MDDHRAIEQLLYRYAERIDDGDFDGIGALFVDGAVATDDGTPIAAGHEAVRALYEATTRRYENGTPQTQHVTTNVIVDVADDGRTATARSCFTVLQGIDGTLQPIITGRYQDSFTKHDGAWRFTERRMEPRLFGDLSRHLLIGPADLDLDS
jgi:ketosteroid isomerase-like protein